MKVTAGIYIKASIDFDTYTSREDLECAIHVLTQDTMNAQRLKREGVSFRTIESMYVNVHFENFEHMDIDPTGEQR
jgi:hypothetical protein